MALTETEILDALSHVQDPDLHRDIVRLGFIKDVAITSGAVAFTLELTTPACPAREAIESECRERVLALEGALSVEINVTSRVRSRDSQPDDLIPGVRQCVAIASGKGGVGKSTVTVNLAVALAQTGAKVGLLDADVYGPSIPLMMGLADQRPLTQDSKLIPIERYGVRTMSLGYLLEDGQAVLWRGPMVAGTVKQLLADVMWGDLDYLLVDLPPGTGDAPMSLAQLVPLSGVVIVTTPHGLAANIAGKAASLFRRLNAPIIGVVENMGEVVCPDCNHRFRLFSGSSGEEFAATLSTVLLGAVPCEPRVSSAAEAGLPCVIENPAGEAALAFREIAAQLAAQLSIRAADPVAAS